MKIHLLKTVMRMLIHLMPKEFNVIYFINTASGIPIPAVMGFQEHTETFKV